MNTFIKRSLSGIVFVGLFIGSLLWNEFSFLAFMLLISVLGTLEFYKMFQKNGYKPQNIFGTILSALIQITIFLLAKEWIPKNLHLIIIILFVAVFLVEMGRKKVRNFSNITQTFAGLIFLSIPLSLLWFILLPSGEASYNPMLFLCFIILIWSYDSFAYVTGSLLGKTKIFPLLSPKKSLEGLIGGAILTFATAWVISLLNHQVNLIHWLVMAAIAIGVGTLGDLSESLLKRTMKVKDSGSLMPGHGGILDRFDSVIMSVPILYVYLQLTNLI